MGGEQREAGPEAPVWGNVRRCGEADLKPSGKNLQGLYVGEADVDNNDPEVSDGAPFTNIDRDVVDSAKSEQ